MSKFTALLIGDFRRQEFSRAAETFGRAGQIAMVNDVAAALTLVDSGQFTPDLIVMACAWPGQFDHAPLYALRRRAPLARFLSVLGSWCEGETRSGSPWPGMLRTYWHHWLPHWSSDLQQFAQLHVTTWGLPQTATDDERLMFAAPSTHDGRGLILIKSASFDIADMLCQSCRQRGYGAVWVPPYREGFVAGVSAVLWDATNVDAVALQRCRKALPTVPIIALIDFPRVEEAQCAQQAGVS
ncbi:MAG: hypothetical protein OES79_13990, partial [Planctomycetota bacterium]|nr:hypothetical protein [Planctomycetota bacterium]